MFTKKFNKSFGVLTVVITFSVHIISILVLAALFSLVLNNLNYYENYYSVFLYAIIIISSIFQGLVSIKISDSVVLNSFVSSLFLCLVMFGISLTIPEESAEIGQIAANMCITAFLPPVFCIISNFIKNNKKPKNKFKFK